MLKVMESSQQSSCEDEEAHFPFRVRKRPSLAVATRIKIIPEGEWGWVICAAAFVSQLIVMGIHNSFGILYTTLLDEYKKSKAQTAWVGSVSIGVMYLFGPITSGLCERFGCRVVAFVGGLLCILGMLLTSFVSDLGKLYVTYGLLWGVGSSFCYFPTLTSPGEYFCRRLSLVNGIVTAGSGIGTLTFGPALQHMLVKYGLVTSLRILSAVPAVLLLTSLAYKPFRSPLEDLFQVKRQPGAFLDLSVWQNKAFCVYTAAVAVFMLGYFIPYVHLVSHAEGMGIKPSKAALLIGFMSIASTISRLVLGKFSDHPRVNRLHMTQLAVVGYGVTTTLCPLSINYPALVALVVVMGLFDGLYVALIAVLNTDIVGVHKLSQALGSLYGVISLTITLGPPCAGLIFDLLDSYHAAFYISGATTTLAACLMFLIPWLIPNQNGGEFRRDSSLNRLESLLGSHPVTPLETRCPESHFTMHTELPRRNDSECDRIEREYFHGFAVDVAHYNSDETDADKMSSPSCISLSTSQNTAFNSSMSKRGSITKHLLQQQLQSRSPTCSRQWSAQNEVGLQSQRSTSRSSSSSSWYGGSRRESIGSTNPFSTTESSSSNRESSTKSSIRSFTGLVCTPIESHGGDSSGPESPDQDVEQAANLLSDYSHWSSGDSTIVGSRRESGISTAICSHRSSVVRSVYNSNATSAADSAQSRPPREIAMLHLLSVRLQEVWEAKNERQEYDEHEERESSL